MKTITLTTGQCLPPQPGEPIRFVVCGPVTVVCRTHEEDHEETLIAAARKEGKKRRRHDHENQWRRLEGRNSQE